MSGAAWNSMDSAPHDGSWVRLNIDGTEHHGRWKPTAFLELGPTTYEWEIRCPDGTADHVIDDRVRGWSAP